MAKSMKKIAGTAMKKVAKDAVKAAVGSGLTASKLKNNNHKELTLDEKMAMFEKGGNPTMSQDDWRAVNGRFKTALANCQKPEVAEHWKSAAGDAVPNKNKCKRTIMLGWLKDRDFGATYMSFAKTVSVVKKTMQTEKWVSLKKILVDYEEDELADLIDAGVIMKRAHLKCAGVMQYCDTFDISKVTEVARCQTTGKSQRMAVADPADEIVSAFDQSFKGMATFSDTAILGMDLEKMILELQDTENEKPTPHLLGLKGVKSQDPKKNGPKIPKEIEDVEAGFEKCKGMATLLNSKGCISKSQLYMI